MKNKFSALFVAFLTFGFATSSYAQYDDLYSIPSDDNEVTQYEAEEEYVAQEATTDHDDYNEYSYLDDQDYYYSSRIKRFNNSNSNSGFGYYSPYFTDAAYYNSANRPGASIYLGNPFSYNAARRAIRSPFQGYGFNSAYSPFYNPYNVGRVGGGFGGYNSFNSGFAGAGGNAYCPPTSYGSSLTRTSRGANNAVTGPRGTSTANSSTRSNDSSVRRGTSRVIRSAQGSDSAGSSRSSSTSTRANTNTRTNRTYDRSNNRSTRSNRSYSTPRSNSSSRTISSPRRSSSRSISSPRSSSSRSSSIRSSSSSRRQ